jgi:hypothetical protein
MVYGGMGIGKSAIPKQVFIEYAKEKNLQFKEWSSISDSREKELIINNAGDYFIFMDIRAAQLDPTFLTGIPNMSKSDMLENIPYSWIIYFTNPRANGIIFFDEINLAAPLIQAITYQIIHDRVISDRKLGDNVFALAAGNRLCDNAHIFDMPDPLKDRFVEVEMEISADEWLKWAIKNNINSHLIAFITWKKSYLYKISENGTDKNTTPRGIEFLSKLIGDMDISDEYTYELAASRCGVGFAKEFGAYIKCFIKLDWNKIYSNPSIIEKFEIDQMYAIMGGLVEQYKESKFNIDTFSKICSVLLHLREDFSIATLKMIKSVSLQQFKDNIRGTDIGKEIAVKYGKYIIK